jgi:hypothetical protein
MFNEDFTMFTVEQAKKSLRLLGLPIHRDNIRKCVRAKYLLDNEHLWFSRHDGDYRVYSVLSQWAGTEWSGGLYTVKLNGTHHHCDCPNSQRDSICKHRIACMMHEYKAQRNGNGHKPATSNQLRP